MSPSRSIKTTRRASSASTRAASRPPRRIPSCTFFREWLARGYAGEMAYLHRSADRRADVRSCRAVGAHRHRHRRPSTTPTARIRTECADPSRAHDRALRVGRRLPRRDRRAPRRAGRVDARAVARAVRRARTTSTPVRCRSASTRSTPASGGSARTPASSTRSSGRGSSSARSSAACRSSPTRRRSISAAPARCASTRARRTRSSRPACSTRRAAFPI